MYQTRRGVSYSHTPKVGRGFLRPSIIFQFLSILPELNRRRRFGRPGSYPLDQGCIYISAPPYRQPPRRRLMFKNSHTDIVLHAAAFRAHIQQRQMRHILAFSQVTFAETCCLPVTVLVSYILYAEPISPSLDYRKPSQWISIACRIFLAKVLYIFFCFSARADNRS